MLTVERSRENVDLGVRLAGCIHLRRPQCFVHAARVACSKSIGIKNEMEWGRQGFIFETFLVYFHLTSRTSAYATAQNQFFSCFSTQNTQQQAHFPFLSTPFPCQKEQRYEIGRTKNEY